MADIPLQEIRKQLGRIERAARKLKSIQASLPLPAPGELEAMIEGERPFSEEAYVLAVLQYAALRQEEGTLNVRGYLHKVNFRNPLLRNRRRRVDIDLGSLIEAVKDARED